jgi:hypothetical protein
MEQMMQHLLHRIDRMLAVGEVGSDQAVGEVGSEQEAKFDIKQCDWWGTDGYSPVLQFSAKLGNKYRVYSEQYFEKVCVIFTNDGACMLEAGTSKFKYVCDAIDISIMKKLYELYSALASKKVDEYGRLFLDGAGYGLEIKGIGEKRIFMFFDGESRETIKYIATFSVQAPKLLKTEFGKKLNEVRGRSPIHNYERYNFGVPPIINCTTCGKHILIYSDDDGIIFRGGMAIPDSDKTINDMKIVYNKRIYYRHVPGFYGPSSASVVGVVELFGGESFMYTAKYAHFDVLQKWQPLTNMDDLVGFMHNNDTEF